MLNLQTMQEYPSYGEFFIETFLDRPDGSQLKEGNKEEICTGLSNYLNKIEVFDPYTIFNNSFDNCYVTFQAQVKEKISEKAIILLNCGNQSNIYLLPPEIIKIISLTCFFIESEEKNALLPCHRQFIGDIYNTIKNNADHKEKFAMQLKPREEPPVANTVISALAPIFNIVGTLYAMWDRK